jgi:hypothetical protein
VKRKLTVIIFEVLKNVFTGLNRPEFFRELNPSAWGRPLAKVSWKSWKNTCFDTHSL